MSEPLVFFPTSHADVFLSAAGEFHLRSAETGQMSSQAWSTMKDAVYAAYERQLGDLVVFMQDELHELDDISKLLQFPQQEAVDPLFDTAARLISAVLTHPINARQAAYLADSLSWERYHCSGQQLLQRLAVASKGVAA